MNGMLRAATIRLTNLLGAGLLGVVLACASLAGAQPSRHSRVRAKTAAALAAPPLSPAPFRPGETLDYQVLFSKYSVQAARIETSVVGQRNFFGHRAWHFRAVAHTMNTTRLLFAIDDQFDSYTSVGNLVSLQYEMYLHEQGKNQTSLYRMTGNEDPALKGVTALRVAPGTRDALGFLYALRAVDWKRTTEFRAPVYDGRHLYDAVARMDRPQATVVLQAGSLAASRIAIRLFDHGKELTDMQLWVWLAKNKARTPVLMEANIPIGDFRVELTRLP